MTKKEHQKSNKIQKQRKTRRFTLRASPEEFSEWETKSVKAGFDHNISAWLRHLANK